MSPGGQYGLLDLTLGQMGMLLHKFNIISLVGHVRNEVKP